MLKSVSVALLALVLAGVAPAESAPEASALLQKVSDTYRGLTNYRFEGEMRLNVAGGAEQHMVIPVLTAADRSGRVYLEVRNPQMGGLLVSDGQRTSMYVSSLNQYTQKAAEPAADSAGMPKPPQNSPIARYFDLSAGVREATVVDEQPVTLNDSPIRCWVVRCDVTQPQIAAGDSTARALATFWVDVERSLVLRDSLSVTMRNRQTGMPMVVEQVTGFSLARVNTPLPDSLFAFTPPAGAKLVDAFGPQGGEEPVSPLVGKPAPTFTLKGVKGSTVSLAAYKGRVVLLDFWATWCGPCRIQMPRVEKLYAEFKPKGLVAFGVDYAEDPATVKAFLERNPHALPILLDRDGAIGKKYEASGIPTLVVIGRDGKVVAHFVGLRDEETLRKALAKAGMK